MATDDIQSKINNVNSLFDNMISQYKSNYINYHKNVTLSMPTLMPKTTSTTSTTSTSKTTTAGHVSSDSHAKDLNDELLTNYRFAANKLLEQVRSQVYSNSTAISKINANINPIQAKYLNILEFGDKFHHTKLAAVSSLGDFDELYKTTLFSIIMYLVGSTSILYLLFKPKLQSV